MRNYLALVPKYLSAHQNKTRLTILSVALAVALITGVFSMLDALTQFEKRQIIHDIGNYHLIIKDASTAEMEAVGSRIDVQNAGRWKELGEASINGAACRLGALDGNFAENMNIRVIKGNYPVKGNEIMLEQWAAQSLNQDIGVNDRVKISLPDEVESEYVVSGIYNDQGDLKAAAVPGVMLSMEAAERVMSETHGFYLIQFKDGVNIIRAEKEIKEALEISEDRIGRNDRLLAVIGQSRNTKVIGLYATGAVLFCIVLVAGVVMIFNTFNISVMERVRQFGLLRCIGASQAQIRKLVRREGLSITLRAIPIGVLAGMLMTVFCSALLKFYNSSLFGDMPLFTFSIIGIGAGIAIGFITVFIASFLPARKAAGVSPVNAVTGNSDLTIPKKRRQGALAKVLPIETAMGIDNAVVKKKSFVLMSMSIAISIIMFLGFQVLIDFMHTGMKTTKPYTPDISLVSDEGMNKGLHRELSDLNGTKKVYGRMFSYVDAEFDAARLTDAYRDSMGGIATRDDGRFDPPEKSWLISYDENQFKWAKADLIAGDLSEEKLNAQNGVIAVAEQLRNSVSTETADLQVGDKVYINTPHGTKEMTVLGILRSVPFSSAELAMTSFITTEKLFTELTGGSSYQVIDIQLERGGQEQTVGEIRGMLNSSIVLQDARQKNAEVDQTFFTMAVFIYGFVAVIGLISVLNIINTMNTSVASRTRYLGIMRAIGMSDSQLDQMVLAEAATYSLTGCVVGGILGIALQQALITHWLSSFHIVWRFPFTQIGLILILVLIMTAISVISPMKRIKAQSISEAIESL